MTENESDGESEFKVIELATNASQTKMIYQKILDIDEKLHRINSIRNELIDKKYEYLLPSEILFLNEYDTRVSTLQQDKLYWQGLVMNMQKAQSVVAGTLVSGFERDVMKIPLDSLEPLSFTSSRTDLYEKNGSIEYLEPSDSVSQQYQGSCTNSEAKFVKRAIRRQRRLHMLKHGKKCVVVVVLSVTVAVVITLCFLLLQPRPTPLPSPLKRGPPTSYTVSTFAGSGIAGYRDGIASTAQFSGPSGIAIDPTTGDIIVADARNNRIRRISNGVVSTVAGNGTAGLRDGTSLEAQFHLPEAVACSPNGDVLVADPLNNAVRVISQQMVSTISANVSYPLGITTDDKGNVLVAEFHPNLITRISRDGTRSTIAGTPQSSNSIDGVGNQASFDVISQIAFDKNGTLYVAEREGGRIRSISPAGSVSTLPGSFRLPLGIAIDSFQIVYVSEGHQISGLLPNGTKILVAGSSSPGDTDGGTQSTFATPRSLAVDQKGVIYVADQENHKIRVIHPKWD